MLGKKQEGKDGFLAMTLDEIYKVLEANPQDYQLYRLLADEAEALGEDVVASGMRWQAENEKSPLWHDDDQDWNWFIFGRIARTKKDYYYLEEDLYKHVESHKNNESHDFPESFKEFYTFRQALESLHLALSKQPVTLGRWANET